MSKSSANCLKDMSLSFELHNRTSTNKGMASIQKNNFSALHNCMLLPNCQEINDQGILTAFGK